ncbi:MAG: nuclear transport factor 2 family protein [Planctomycetota bacterium]|nr:nuclear transport factor 2 family protein [Planctomycetota bacterium]
MPTTQPSIKEQLTALTHRIVESIDNRDYETYTQLTAPDLTAFEPEGKGAPIHGMPFHEFFLSRANRPGTTVRSELINIHIRTIGDESNPPAAVATYTRITQKHDADGSFRLTHANETRVYERHNNNWRQIHFHRTAY